MTLRPIVLCLVCVIAPATNAAARPPNVLFAISDDQSWMHAGVYGDRCVKTPAFDRIAARGVRFDHAYVACSSCTPSRSAILTGQAIWRLEVGGVLWGHLPSKFEVFPRILEQAGYFVGHTGKGWGPGSERAGGWDVPPTGQRYDQAKLTPPMAIHALDYAANFRAFLRDRPADRPFCFWLGTHEPHRPYREGAGLAAGKQLADARLPGCLPEAPETRGDVLDYYTEIEHFDRHLGNAIAAIAESGELENTLVIVTSDNGMCFPRGKANLYDTGTRVPLAICWPAEIPANRVAEDFVSLTDLAPTILEAAGLAVPEAMTGKSLLALLRSSRSGRIDPARDFVVTAIERHTLCRPGHAGYPMRAIRTDDYLYIRNYAPDRWPAGDPDIVAEPQGIYGDISRSPSKDFILANRHDPRIAPLFALAFGKRPAEELYNIKVDSEQLQNVAEQPGYAAIKAQLQSRLQTYLERTEDPRLGGTSPWDHYPYYGEGGKTPLP